MQEHPFAPYIRILGKGKQGSRSLTEEEAYQAMAMILENQVLPEQLGAFLMLLRMKEESPEELAGFTKAIKQKHSPVTPLQVDLDWSSYAGKKNHLPWFILSAFALADAGYRVFMHGASGHTIGRIYTVDVLAELGVKAAEDWSMVSEQLNQSQFSFMPLSAYVKQLDEIIQLRHVLGLRSPIHTLARMLNPTDARCSIDGVFHPAYGPIHQKTAMMLGTPRNLTLKGDGGEAEARPDADTLCQWVLDGELSEELWPRIANKRFVKENSIDAKVIRPFWRGELSHEYGELAVLSTLALTLRLVESIDDGAKAFERAREVWQQRNLDRF